MDSKIVSTLCNVYLPQIPKSELYLMYGSLYIPE
jgi:hypothetical protein